MKVLFVTGTDAASSPLALTWLTEGDPSLETRVLAGAAAALVELRSNADYRGVLIDPGVTHNEALALIATIRRDRLPLSVVVIVTESDLPFFAAALTAGADDVLLMTTSGLLDAVGTLDRIRSSRHLERDMQPDRLHVLYVGNDDLAWDLIGDMPFVSAARSSAGRDGAFRLTRTGAADSDIRPEVVVVDEHAGESHALQVVKWIRSQSAQLPIILLTSATGADVGGAALDLGADDVISKAGTYRRRLVAILHKVHRLLRRAPAPAAATPVDAAADADHEAAAAAHEAAIATLQEELASVRAALATADKRIGDLAAEARVVTDKFDTQRQQYAELQESQAFDRALRDRDRDELNRVRQSLAEERERRIVLEGTLRQTENRAASEAQALEARHAEARRLLESQLATAADRLHQVANETQALQAHLQTELATQTAERDRIIQSELFGYGVMREDGRLERANAAFARMFGFDSVDDAVAAGAEKMRERVADHDHVLGELRAERTISHVESVLMRASGRPFHVLTSAALVPLEPGSERVGVERLIIDQDDRTRLEEQLRLTRRLETAGRLGAEMADVIEPGLAAVADAEGVAADREPTLARIRQLLAFCRRQGKAAGLLSLTEAIARTERHVRQTAGDAVTFSIHVEDVPPIAAGEDDIEQLVTALVHAAVGSLPYGGDVALEARPVRSGFDLRTELAVRATGYGVQTISISSFLARLVTRCGGTVRVSDDPGRSTRLLVHLPC